MHDGPPPGNAATEAQALNRDLVALLALPAMWPATAGRGRIGVVEVLLDVLRSLLRLDWVFARMAEPPADFAYVQRKLAPQEAAARIAAALGPALDRASAGIPPQIEDPFDGRPIRLAAATMSVNGGVVIAASRRATFPTQRDSFVLRAAVNQTTIGVEAARLMEGERRRSAQLARLAEAALAVQRGHSLDEVLGIITDAAREVVGAHMAVTSMTVNLDFAQAINAVSLSDRYAAWRGYDAKPDGTGIYRLVCETNRPMRLTQAQLEAHPGWRGFGKEAGRHPPLIGWLAAPLVAREGTNLGLIQLSHKLEGVFDEADERILVQLAQMAAAAIESARLTDDLRRTQALALEADRRKDEFLAILGHELRNPLAPILTALQLMRLRGDQTSQRERAVVERQLMHLVRLVDDLLDVSRITRGKIDLKREVVELAEVVAKAIETSSPLLEQKEHRLEVAVPARGLAVWGDPVRLAQVVSNLLANAAKYTEARGRISVAGSLEGDRAVLRVRDSGVGIEPAILPTVFDPFVQERQSLERSQGGLGLGLTIVRSLTALHDGTVEAHSDGRGRGSEFVVRLPLATDRSGRAAGQQVPPPRPRSDAKLVLVVDDNTDAADLLADSLRQLGHQARVAYDGPSALDAVALAKPDCVILDIGLPVMDGYEVAERLRARPDLQGVKLVAVTGYGQETDRERSRRVGFDEHLVKPVELETLLAIIDGPRPC